MKTRDVINLLCRAIAAIEDRPKTTPEIDDLIDELDAYLDELRKEQG